MIRLRLFARDRRIGLVAVAAALAVSGGFVVLAGVGAEPAEAQVVMRSASGEAPLGRMSTMSQSDHDHIAALMNAEITACVRAHGYPQYSAPPHPSALAFDPYGHMDLEIVRVYGYGLPSDPGASPIDYAPAGSPIWDVLGDPSSGCLHDAADAVFGNAEAYGRAGSELMSVQNESIGAALSDPRYGRAIEDWSSCMSGAGYPAQDFNDAVTRYGIPHEESVPATPGEVAAALVDYDCRQSTKVNDIFEAIAVEFQLEHASEHASAVAIVNRGLQTSER
jgi:hypothetical protein